MKKEQLSNLFERFADLLEFNGDTPFKINAYRRAARTLAELDGEIEPYWREGRLGELAGIGKGLQEKIEQFLSQGRIRQYDELLERAPKQLFELLSIPHFGPKTAALAHKELGVQTLEDLNSALENGSLAALPGMGAKKIEKIRQGLEFRRAAEKRISIGYALPLAEEAVSYLREKAGDAVGRISPAGSVRRVRETVHDVDILVETDRGLEVIGLFTKWPRVSRVLGAGHTKASVMIDDRFQIDLRAVKGESWGAALQYFTGSAAHNVRIRELARKKGDKVNEYGIFAGEDRVGGEKESDVYSRIGMPWIAPELREDRGEIEAALQDRLPDLIEPGDIRADLHVHSTWSDGQLPMEQMASHLRERGYAYMAFCDHSRAAYYANGLDPERLRRQGEEIMSLNERMAGFTVLAGVEVDILPDGKLDLDDETLAGLDFVIASIHSAFNSDPTARTLAAMENRYVDVIAHPTGRLISRRGGFEIDMERVIEGAARTGTALEINAYWDRLDLSDLNVKRAVESGVRLAINTDAHHPHHLPMMALGVGTARRGWASARDVINTLPLEQLRKWQKRSR